ncbi:hypothetical protein ACEW7V_02875 [Areca yellow leaf disease phytoplasma]|uniref:hypothetical protein n=1 Tax=Areca yellow leaf disease phytoplasma TaxID=927614 RepID=UPI0035B5437C
MRSKDTAAAMAGFFQVLWAQSDEAKENKSHFGACWMAGERCCKGKLGYFYLLAGVLGSQARLCSKHNKKYYYGIFCWWQELVFMLGAYIVLLEILAQQLITN